MVADLPSNDMYDRVCCKIQIPGEGVAHLHIINGLNCSLSAKVRCLRQEIQYNSRIMKRCAD
jgi:hypothetical protein